MFTVTFDTQNAAFEFVTAQEIARILRAVAVAVEEDGVGDSLWNYSIRDYNGNRVGIADYKP